MQAKLHNSLALLWRAAFHKGTVVPLKAMKVIALFVGYSGANSFLPISDIIDLNNVKPKLADGMWLGERCGNKEHLEGFFFVICSQFMKNSHARKRPKK